MQIKTFNTLEYRKLPIYIRYIMGANIFEYFFAYKNELYTAHVVVTKPFFSRILGRQMSEEHEKAVYRRMVAMAQTTIDLLLDENTK